jgi:acetyl-CoA synthetase
MSALVSLAEFAHEVPEGRAERAYVDASKYREMFAFSASKPDEFWDYHGRRIEWIQPYSKVKNTCFDPGKVSIKWFEDGTTNVSMNCIDRILPTVPTRPRLSGKATTPTTPSASRTDSCMSRFAVSQMC